ncbi:MAG: alpha/beta fold hydrolase [Pseudomonadales bacterium]
MPGTRYRPSRWLRNPHLQTMLGSVARRSVVPETERTYLDNAVIEDITTCDGTVLRARVNRHTEPAPQVVLIHGWLGNDGSSYVRSAGARLWQAGFNTVRMNLRDHGDTEELNQDLYNSARTVEVVDLVDQYRQRNAGDTAVIGFSLGGNFALRVARDTGLPALAVCPAIDPGDTLHQIDHGPGALVYRNYFVRKWRASLVRKAQAFPARYDFSRAFTLRSVSALTDFSSAITQIFPAPPPISMPTICPEMRWRASVPPSLRPRTIPSSRMQPSAVCRAASISSKRTGEATTPS